MSTSLRIGENIFASTGDRLGKLIAGISTYSINYLFIYYTNYLKWNENSFGNELLIEMLGRALE